MGRHWTTPPLKNKIHQRQFIIFCWFMGLIYSFSYLFIYWQICQKQVNSRDNKQLLTEVITRYTLYGDNNIDFSILINAMYHVIWFSWQNFSIKRNLKTNCLDYPLRSTTQRKLKVKSVFFTYKDVFCYRKLNTVVGNNFPWPSDVYCKLSFSPLVPYQQQGF